MQSMFLYSALIHPFALPFSLYLPRFIHFPSLLPWSECRLQWDCALCHSCLRNLQQSYFMDSFIFSLNGCSEFILIVEKISFYRKYLFICLLSLFIIIKIYRRKIVLITISINIIHKPLSWTENFPKAFSANIYLLIEYKICWFSGCCCCFLFSIIFY